MQKLLQIFSGLLESIFMEAPFGGGGRSLFISRGNGGGLFATSQPSPSTREANFSVVVSRRIRFGVSKKPASATSPRRKGFIEMPGFGVGFKSPVEKVPAAPQNNSEG